MQKAIKGNRIPWVSDEELKSAYSNQDVPFDKIGIPQGGAISPLLANIMLHSVDNSVLQEDGILSLLLVWDGGIPITISLKVASADFSSRPFISMFLDRQHLE